MIKNYLYLIISFVLLSSLGLLVKIIGDSIPFMTLNFYRILFAFLFLLIIVPFLDKTTFKLKLKDIPMYVLIGLLFALGTSLNNVAYLHAPISNVALITSLYPFFVLIFAYFLLREKITTTKIITLVIAIAGLVIINPLQMGDGFLGNILALIVAAVDGILITLMRKEDKTHSIGDVFWFVLFALIFLLPFPIVNGFAINSISWTLVALGIISTGVVYLFMNLGYEKIEAEIGSSIQLVITPLIAIILAIIFLNETISLKIIIGGLLLIISGIYLQFHLKKQKI